MSTVSFMGLKLSYSELAGSMLEPLVKGLVTNYTGVRTDFGTTAALPNLIGDTKNVQQGRKDMALGALRQIITGLVQGQQTISAGGAQLTAAKTQLVATESSARALGFDVLPNGVVRVSQPQRAYCRARWDQGGEGLLRVFEAWAAHYTAQIQGTLTQASTVDAQIATALVSLATQYLTSLFEKKPDTAAGLPPVTNPPTATPPPTTVPGPGSPPTGTGTGTTVPPVDKTPLGGSASGIDTALAGAGPLGGAGGAGALGAGSVGTHLGGAAAGAAAAMAGTAGAGVVGLGQGAGAAGAGRGLAATGVMPMGAGAHGGGGQARGEHATEAWLVEDGESWNPGDAPEGVIA